MQISSSRNNKQSGALSVNKQGKLAVFQEISGCAAASLRPFRETAEESQKVVKFNNSHQSGELCLPAKGE